MTPENVASDFTTFFIAESILLVLVLIVLPIITICRTRNRATVERTCITPRLGTIIGFYFGSGGSGHSTKSSSPSQDSELFIFSGLI